MDNTSDIWTEVLQLLAHGDEILPSKISEETDATIHEVRRTCAEMRGLGYLKLDKTGEKSRWVIGPTAERILK